MGAERFICIAFLFVCCVNAFMTPTTQEYQINNIEVLGSKLTLGLVNFTFDEEIYIPKAVNCGPALNSTWTCNPNEVNELACPPCDYTNLHGACGVTIAGCSCPLSYLCQHDTTKPQTIWTDLAPNAAVAFNSTDKPVYLRYYNNKPCSGFSIRTLSKYVAVTSMYSWDSPYTVFNSAPIHYGDKFILSAAYTQAHSWCPNDADHGYFQLGTLFITIFPDSLTPFTIQSISGDLLREVPAVSDKVASAMTAAQKTYPNHIPIYDGQTEDRDFGDADHITYFYILDACQVVSVRVMGIPGDVDLSISDDLNLPEPYYDSNYGGGRFGEDYATMTFCPDEGQDTKILFITVILSNAASYRITVSSTAPRYLVPLDFGYPFSTFLELSGAVILTTAEGTEISCPDYIYYCNGVFGTFPATSPNALFPLFYQFKALSPLDIDGIDFGHVYDPIFSPKTLQAFVTLYYDIKAVKNSPVSLEQFMSASFRVAATISDANYMPIIGNFVPKPNYPVCDYADFAHYMDMLQENLDKVQNSTVNLAIRQADFNLDSLTQFNAWSHCQHMANSFAIVNSESYEAETTDCIAGIGTADYDADPCCSPSAAFSQCCRPTLKNLTRQIVSGVNTDILNEQCASPSCSATVTNDYNRIANNLRNCDFDSAEFDQFNVDIYTSIRQCSAEVFQESVFCMNDGDCANANFTGVYCNILNHRCVFPIEQQNTLYVKCMTPKITGSVKIFLQSSLGISTSSTDDELFTALLSAVKDNDCMAVHPLRGNVDLRMRTHYELDGVATSCSGIATCNITYCKDNTCQWKPSYCDQNCRRGWNLKHSSESSCAAGAAYCNWATCRGLAAQNCTQLCETGPQNYCGFCLNPEYCPEVQNGTVTTTSGTTCKANMITCLNSDGTLNAVSSADECTSHGSCTTPCGGCVSSDFAHGACYFANQDETVCNDTGRIYVDGGCADDVINATACVEEGGVWSSCPTTLDGCVAYGANGGDFLQCHWDYSVPCATKEACLGTSTYGGGVCSDSAAVPAGGSCIVPYVSGYPMQPGSFCTSSQLYTPMGCSDPTVPQVNCTDDVGSWYTPQFTQSACTAKKGCFEVTTILLPVISYPLVYNFKTEEECGMCGQGSWQSLFSWTPARWIPGQVVTPKVVQREHGNRYVWQNTLSYINLENILLAAVSNLSTTAYKAEAYCKFNLLKSTLNNLVCDCTDGGKEKSECYITSPTTLTSVTTHCSGESAKSLTTSTFNITLPDAKDKNGCTQISVSALSTSTFRTVQAVRLAAYFADFQSTEEYAAKNYNGGIMGAVLGDGIVFSSNQATPNAEICVTQSQDTKNSEFTVLDFANSAADYSYLTPREVKVHKNDDGQLCAFVDIPSGESIFIPIKRIEKWASITKNYFSPTNLQLLYTLAIIYLVVAFFAFLQLLAVVVEKFTKKRGRSKFGVSVIITLTLFVYPLIRCLYFFLLPTGILSASGGDVAEYILVVLPTFPYFTAFSFVPIVWSLLTAAATQIGSDFKNTITHTANRMMKMVVGINAGLYIMFIIIVITFNYTGKVEFYECLGQTYNTTQQSPAQVAISIVYSVIVATVSLGIAVSFIFFGSRAANLPQNSETVKKTYQMACVCAVGFGLNCIFIIVAIGAKINNIGFSFAGLILTEIVPTLFMLWNFGCMTALKRVIRKTTGRGSQDTASSLGSLATFSTNDDDSSGVI